MSPETSRARSHSRVPSCDGEVDRGQVAGVVAVARTDQERHEIAGLHRELFQRSDGTVFGPWLVPVASRCRVIAATQFERPGHAVAAFRMCVLDGRADREASPARDCASRPRRRALERMHGDAVRFHVAGNADVLIGRVGHDASASSPPQPLMKS